MNDFATEGLLGTNFARRTLEPEHRLGVRQRATSGKDYIYVQASGSIAESEVCSVSSSFIVTSSDGPFTAETAFTDGEYGWVRQTSNLPDEAREVYFDGESLLGWSGVTDVRQAFEYINNNFGLDNVELGELSDVTLTSIQDDDLIIHNSGVFVNIAKTSLLDLNDLSDVSAGSPSTDDVLVYNGSNFVLEPNNNHTHSNSDITGLGTLATRNTVDTSHIEDDAVTFDKIANVAQNTLIGRYTPSTGSLQSITVGDGLDLLSPSGVLVCDVLNVHGRTGDVVAAASDYDASQIDNDSGVSGTFVDDALNTLNAGKANSSHTHTLADIINSSLYSFESRDSSSASTMAGFSTGSVGLLGDQLVKKATAAGTASITSDLNQDNLKSLFDRSGETYTVDTSGADFTSISEAIKVLSSRRHAIFGHNQSPVTINIETGFQPSEQIFHTNGDDLSWLTITSTDATVTIDHTALTVEPMPNENGEPFLFVSNGGTLPVIDTLFDFSVGNNQDFILAVEGSKVIFKSGAGCNRPRRGIRLLGGSLAYCHIDGLTQGGGGSGAGTTPGITLTNATNRAIELQHGSRAYLPRSDCQGCSSDITVYVIWNSFLDIYQSDIGDNSNLTGTCLVVRDGSVCCARDVNADESDTGIHALHAGIIDFRRDLSTTYGANGVKNSGDYGVHASSGSTIDATDVVATGCYRGVHSSGGSTVYAQDGVLTACTYQGLYATSASRIAADGANVSGFLRTGGGVGAVHAQHGSTIDFEGGDAGQSDNPALWCLSASTINADGADCDDCDATADGAVVCARGSTISFNGGTADNSDTRGIYATDCGLVHARSASLDNAASHAVQSRRGSLVDVTSATGTSAGGNGVRATELGLVNAQSFNASTSTDSGFEIERGSIINVDGGTGSLSHTANTTPVAAGIIFQ